MDCRCAEKIEKELSKRFEKEVCALYTDILNKEISISFKEVGGGADILVKALFCPFCGEKYRFADEDKIKKYRGE